MGKESMEERLTVRQGHDADSHTSGFEAWLRSRGHDDGQVYTADDIVEKYGVAKGSYDTVPLPNIRAYQAVVRDLGDFKKKATYLKSLGATEVLPDNGSLIEELGELKFFAKAKLGLDCVGGPSAARLAHCLDEGAQLVVYGCMSGQSPSFSRERWVDGEMQCRGFNLRRWMNSHRKEIPAMLLSLAKLVNNDRLSINYTEYELSSEFEEALDHAMEDGKMTKVILKVKDIGTTY